MGRLQVLLSEKPRGQGENQAPRDEDAGNNQGLGLKSEQFPEQARPQVEGCPLPLPLGGTDPEAGRLNAPKGVISTAPGSPFEDVNPGDLCPQ